MISTSRPPLPRGRRGPQRPAITRPKSRRLCHGDGSPEGAARPPAGVDVGYPHSSPSGVHNGHAQRPGREHRERPVRWNVWFGRPCVSPHASLSSVPSALIVEHEPDLVTLAPFNPREASDDSPQVKSRLEVLVERGVR